VKYGDTGVMTFMVSHDGVVYEKDLGPNTAARAGAITRFDPDSTWIKSTRPSSKLIPSFRGKRARGARFFLIPS